MSQANKPLVDKSFEIVRQYLQSVVPPCSVAVDTPTHYEVVAINGDEKHVFGYVVAHEHVITIGFNDKIPAHDLKELISEHLIKKMGDAHHRFEVRDADIHSLTKDLQQAIEKLARYYNEKGWTKA